MSCLGDNGFGRLRSTLHPRTPGVNVPRDDHVLQSTGGTNRTHVGGFGSRSLTTRRRLHEVVYDKGERGDVPDLLLVRPLPCNADGVGGLTEVGGSASRKWGSPDSRFAMYRRTRIAGPEARRGARLCRASSTQRLHRSGSRVQSTHEAGTEVKHYSKVPHQRPISPHSGGGHRRVESSDGAGVELADAGLGDA